MDTGVGFAPGGSSSWLTEGSKGWDVCCWALSPSSPSASLLQAQPCLPQAELPLLPAWGLTGLQGVCRVDEPWAGIQGPECRTQLCAEPPCPFWLKRFDSCCCHWFTFASHLTSLGLAFLSRETGELDSEPETHLSWHSRWDGGRGRTGARRPPRAARSSASLQGPALTL